ncbi:aspartate/glutamate racemase family protein [Elioraea rosea]|uniref:aspartate/glutamate racemase family protein n=1 Tax=Elioraea rosea TaxID=2492390 RepID=UPI0011829472|nr:aspartate/glutamate racemase family protein [Elioraea rosea]
MRLLLLNANTDAAITARMAALAAPMAGDSVTIEQATARFGARYITTRAAATIAAHATLDAFAAHLASAAAPPDAVLLACFGDPGLAALRELAPVPVAGMAEASLLAAASLGGRIGVLTGGERWVPMLGEYFAAIGLGGRTIIRAVPQTGAEIAADPDGAVAGLAREASALVEDGAEVVILGGAGLAGLSGRIAARVPVPVLDSLAAGLSQAMMLARLGPSAPSAGSYAAPPPSPVTGLSDALSRLLAGG